MLLQLLVLNNGFHLLSLLKYQGSLDYDFCSYLYNHQGVMHGLILLGSGPVDPFGEVS